MSKGIEAIRVRMKDIQDRQNSRDTINPVTNKEKSLFDTLEACEELYARGYRISKMMVYSFQDSLWSLYSSRFLRLSLADV